MQVGAVGRQLGRMNLPSMPLLVTVAEIMKDLLISDLDRSENQRSGLEMPELQADMAHWIYGVRPAHVLQNTSHEVRDVSLFLFSQSIVSIFSPLSQSENMMYLTFYWY